MWNPCEPQLCPWSDCHLRAKCTVSPGLIPIHIKLRSTESAELSRKPWAFPAASLVFKEHQPSNSILFLSLWGITCTQSLKKGLKMPCSPPLFFFFFLPEVITTIKTLQVIIPLLIRGQKYGWSSSRTYWYLSECHLKIPDWECYENLSSKKADRVALAFKLLMVCSIWKSCFSTPRTDLRRNEN